jgi:hypothetical protein
MRKMIAAITGASTMKTRRPAWMTVVVCGFVIVLTSCSNMPNPFASSPPPPPPPAPAPTLSCTETDGAYARRVRTLEAQNAKLKRELADAVQDDAALKRELDDAMQDNSMLKDLAAKKPR